MPPALTTRAAACLNLLVFIGAFLVQAGFGLLPGCWKPAPQLVYPLQAYQAAFGLLIVLQLPGLAGHLRRCFGRQRAPGPACSSVEPETCSADWPASGKMAFRTGRQVRCATVGNPKDDDEISALWPARQGKAGLDR